MYKRCFNESVNGEVYFNQVLAGSLRPSISNKLHVGSSGSSKKVQAAMSQHLAQNSCRLNSEIESSLGIHGIIAFPTPLICRLWGFNFVAKQWYTSSCMSHGQFRNFDVTLKILHSALEKNNYERSLGTPVKEPNTMSRQMVATSSICWN